MEEKKEERKFSYEELNNIAHQLGQQNEKLFRELNKANLNNMFKRLDYLFKIIEYSPVFPKDFVEKSIAEVQDIMTIPENIEEKEEKSESK